MSFIRNISAESPNKLKAGTVIRFRIPYFVYDENGIKSINKERTNREHYAVVIGETDLIKDKQFLGFDMIKMHHCDKSDQPLPPLPPYLEYNSFIEPKEDKYKKEIEVFYQKDKKRKSFYSRPN
ncbi:MAG: hypothetical protein K6G50_06875 [bacterium]|nr:hypothetical protein [bacterium]